MTVAQKLEKTSGIFFFSGFLLSKLQYIPFTLASAIFRFISLGLYMVAYGLWLTANILHPDHKEHRDQWYGFAQIKEQFLFSSFVGLVATIVSVTAVFIPILFPPAAWLFFIGNALWSVGEYHKLKNPPRQDPNFSQTRQQNYLAYAITSTTISLVTALATTLMFLFPPMIVPITIFSLLICIGLGAFAFEFWLNSSFEDHKSAPVPNSYMGITDQLGPSVSAEPTDSPKPNHSDGLFAKQTVKTREIHYANSSEENSKSMVF